MAPKMRREKSYRSQAGSVEYDSLGPIFALPRLPEAFSQFEKGLIRTLDRNLLSDNIEYDDLGPVCALPRLPSSDLEGEHTAEKKLVRRIDTRLLPIMGGLYAISMIDRANVGCPAYIQAELTIEGAERARCRYGRRFTAGCRVSIYPHPAALLHSSILFRGKIAH
jgi:hypothetical protein